MSWSEPSAAPHKTVLNHEQTCSLILIRRHAVSVWSHGRSRHLSPIWLVLVSLWCSEFTHTGSDRASVLLQVRAAFCLCCLLLCYDSKTRTGLIFRSQFPQTVTVNWPQCCVSAVIKAQVSSLAVTLRQVRDGFFVAACGSEHDSWSLGEMGHLRRAEESF